LVRLVGAVPFRHKTLWTAFVPIVPKISRYLPLSFLGQAPSYFAAQNSFLG
jgi:hypothetical protein